jgi:hypothetical protein
MTRMSFFKHNNEMPATAASTTSLMMAEAGLPVVKKGGMKTEYGGGFNRVRGTVI